MDYSFLNQFHPRIIEVIKRDRVFWEEHNYQMIRAQTKLHTLVLVTEGKGFLELDELSSPLQAGTLFQIAPGNQLSIHTQQEESLTFISIHYNYGLVQWDGNGMQINRTKAYLPLERIISLQVKTFLMELFDQAYDLWNEKNVGYEWSVKIAFLKIIEELVSLKRYYNENKQQSAIFISDTIDYIKLHYNEDINRDSMANHVSLSSSYFSTLFKKHTGISPMQYLNKIRLDKAKKLLRSTKIPITEVSHQVGFLDSFYFARVFTKETGMSPREYRKG